MDRDQVVESLMRASTGYSGPLPPRAVAAAGSLSMNGRQGLDRLLSRSFSKSGSIRRATDTNIDYQAPAPAAIRRMPGRSYSFSTRRASDTNVEVPPARIQTGRPFPMMPRMRASDSNVDVVEGGRMPSLLGPSSSFSIGQYGSGSGRKILSQPATSLMAPSIGRYRRRTIDNLLESVAEERSLASPTGGDESQPR